MDLYEVPEVPTVRVKKLGATYILILLPPYLSLRFYLQKEYYVSRGRTEQLSSALDAPFNARDLHKMERHTSKMEDHFRATNIECRLEKLRRQGPSLTDEAFQAEYERISRDVDDAMRAGIKTVKKKNIGYARSPVLTRAILAHPTWRTAQLCPSFFGDGEVRCRARYSPSSTTTPYNFQGASSSVGCPSGSLTKCSRHTGDMAGGPGCFRCRCAGYE